MKVFNTGDIDNSMWLKYWNNNRLAVGNDCYVRYTVAEEIYWDEEKQEPSLDAIGNEIPIITEIDEMLLEAGASVGEEIIVEHMW